MPGAKPGPPMPSRPLGVAYLRDSGRPAQVVELFLDLCCPFSKKMFNTLVGGGVISKMADVDFVFMPVVQPWHPQSTLMHEAALAVREVAGPQKFWEFCEALFAKQENFFDDAVADKSRSQIYAELLEIAASVGVQTADVGALLALKGSGNAGNGVTQEIKWATKLHRVRGVHVTPTVFLNGLEAGAISSGWSAEEFVSYLTPES
mmetsp:Transcript_44802/g.115952  ORF Transcript_44802/g.115952 Transcript_44802/m.115952 type:complete len:205 (+) Transcript_44802:71-685(+)